MPYALACALSIPERLSSVGVAACVGPHDVPGLTQGLDPNILTARSLSVERPRLARFVWRMMGIQARYAPNRLIARSMRSFPKLDHEAMARPEVQQAFVASLTRATTRAGVQQDMTLMSSSWGFDLLAA